MFKWKQKGERERDGGRLGIEKGRWGEEGESVRRERGWRAGEKNKSERELSVFAEWVGDKYTVMFVT